MGDRTHWDTVYVTKSPQAVSWFEDGAGPVSAAALECAAGGGAVIDIGGGASRLVDRLLAAGAGPVTVLDISAQALAVSRARLGPLAAKVEWIVADVTHWHPRRQFRLWHDRAVFHFLTEKADRRAYLNALQAALEPGGTALIATFAADGPDRCSGLPVCRYSPDELAAEINDCAPGLLRPVGSDLHLHRTPGGGEQKFQLSRFQRTP